MKIEKEGKISKDQYISKLQSDLDKILNIQTERFITHVDEDSKINTKPFCEWTEDDDGNWETSCKNMHVFFDAGPTQNGYKFCPYCGKDLVAKELSDEFPEEGAQQ